MNSSSLWVKLLLLLLFYKEVIQTNPTNYMYNKAIVIHKNPNQ
jgi:hypothetical protein